MNQNFDDFSPELIVGIVDCISEAFNNDIRADIQRSNLQTRNSVPSRKWDLLNRNLMATLNQENYQIIKAQRGCWEMLIVFEKSSQYIMTFMREERFSILQKAQRSRRKKHYIDILTKQFNSDLSPGHQQLSLYPHQFDDEDQVTEAAYKLLCDLGSNIDVVRHHVLILFKTIGNQLTSIRAVMVTPSLEIAEGCEQNWSRYIRTEESVVVDKVINPAMPENQPNRGLELTAKAIVRRKNRPQIKDSEGSNQKKPS